ncbi:Odorant receptor 45b, partial [Gryllus bimaculatus]
MFIHSLGMSMLLCASVLLLTSGLEGIKLVAVALFAFYEIGELFMYCVMGTEIQTVSVECGLEAYSSAWYEAPISSKRSLQMLLLRAQRPAEIRAAGFTTLSLELFA